MYIYFKKQRERYLYENKSKPKFKDNIEIESMHAGDQELRLNSIFTQEDRWRKFYNSKIKTDATQMDEAQLQPNRDVYWDNWKTHYESGGFNSNRTLELRRSYTDNLLKSNSKAIDNDTFLIKLDQTNRDQVSKSNQVLKRNFQDRVNRRNEKKRESDFLHKVIFYPKNKK